MNKTTCPISLATFLAQAKAVTLTVDGREYKAEPREFSKGSFGWYFGDKVTVDVGEHALKCQTGCTLTVVGSKDAPRGNDAVSVELNPEFKHTPASMAAVQRAMALAS